MCPINIISIVFSYEGSIIEWLPNNIHGDNMFQGKNKTCMQEVMNNQENENLWSNIELMVIVIRAMAMTYIVS